MDENSDTMHLLYIQKQEQIIVDNIRSKIDYEIRMQILNDRINKHQEQVNQLQMTLQAQQELNKQAVESFERVTLEKNNLVQSHNSEKTGLMNTVKMLEEKVRELEKGAHELTTKTIEFNNSRTVYENRIKDLKSEINRQVQELDRLHNQLSSKKKKKPELLVEQPTDSGTF